MSNNYQIYIHGQKLVLQTVSPIIESICNWNKARYEQKYDHDLACKLLMEEFEETNTAMMEGDMVELADGLADIFYVAIGCMWKADTDISDILEVLDEAYSLPLTVALNWHPAYPSRASLASVAVSAFALLEQYTSEEAAIKIIEAVCKSNDTKVVNMVASNVKANLDKGDTYVAPTKDIEDILKSIGKL